MIRAGAAHAAILAAIHRTAFPEDPWPEAAFESLLAQPGVAGYVDPRGGMVLLRGVLDEAEILTIGVMEKRRGIGRALMQAAIAHLKSQDVRVLHLEVGARNDAAMALYRALGFRETGRRRGYYENGGDALILTLNLLD